MKVETLKLLRQQAGLTQEELAQLMAVSRQYVRMMEAGTRPITDRMVKRIRQVFKLDKKKKKG